MKFGQQYLSEKVALSLIIFAGYMRQILYIYTDFQASERLHGGPTFSGNYLIDYTIGFIRKVNCYWVCNYAPHFLGG